MTVSNTVWQTVCSVADLVPYSGVAARFGDQQVAIFYLPHLSPSVYTIGNYDPFSEANVIARGIIGDTAGELCVASPLYKQHFSLVTGQCLEDENVIIPAFQCRIENNQVELSLK